MAEQVEIADASELPPGARRCVTAQGRPLAVFNVDGRYLAIENVCPHAGLPLAEGELRGRILTCPFHGFTYNIESGQNVDFDDEPLRRYPVHVENGKVWVSLEPLSPEKKP
jgi:nitrite reductase/ring-hydroxylating ferredoxin subunit